MEEISQWLADNSDNTVYGVDITTESVPLSQFMLKRYKKTNNIIKVDEMINIINESNDDYCVIINNGVLSKLFTRLNDNSRKMLKVFRDNYKRLKGIYLVNSRNTYEAVNASKKDMFKNADNYRIYKKMYVLCTPGYECKIRDENVFRNRYIDIIRGFYFNHYLDGIESNDTWLIHNSYDDNTENRYDTQLVSNAEKLLESLGEKYIHITDTEVDYSVYNDVNSAIDWNPANTYKGTVYIRHNDYMPRLPYEFWHYNKPVIFLAISDGIEKAFGNSIELQKKIIMKDTLEMDLTNLVRHLSD